MREPTEMELIVAKAMFNDFYQSQENSGIRSRLNTAMALKRIG